MSFRFLFFLKSYFGFDPFFMAFLYAPPWKVQRHFILEFIRPRLSELPEEFVDFITEPVLFFRLCKWLDSCWQRQVASYQRLSFSMAMIFRFRWRSIFGGFGWRSLFSANGPSRSNLRSGRFAGRDERQGRHSFDDWSRSRTVATSGNQLRNDD